MEKEVKKIIVNLIDDFAKWYYDVRPEGGTQGSSKSYKSYIRCAFREVEQNFSEEITKEDSFSKNLICSVFQNAEDLRMYLYSYWTNVLERKKEDWAKGINQKTKSNVYVDYISGVRAFFEYLEDVILTELADLDEQIKNNGRKIKNNIKKSDLIVKIKENINEIIYNKAMMVKTFMLRLNTQDRVYEDVVYPARLLLKIFNNSNRKNEYREELEKLILKTKILYNKNKDAKAIKDISKISIGKDCITIDNDKTMFTELAEEGKPLQEFIAKTLADVSLDHDKPLKKEFSQRRNVYPNLYNLSDFIKEKSNITNTAELRKNVRVWTKNIYNENKEFLGGLTNGLFQDVQKLFDNIEMTLMEKKENSKKRDKFDK